MNVASENVKVAHAQEEAARAQAEAALAQVKNSELQLSYCTIVAPVSGRIARKNGSNRESRFSGTGFDGGGRG